MTDKELLSRRLSGGNEEITKRTRSVWSVSWLMFGPLVSSVRVEYRPYLFMFFVTLLRTEASPSFCTFFLSRLDGPGFKFRQGREIFFPPKPSRLATGPRSLLFKGYRVSVSGLNDWGVKLTTNYLVPRIGMGGAVPLLPLCVQVQICLVLSYLEYKCRCYL